MKIETVTETTCDTPSCVTIAPGEPGEGWLSGRIRLAGRMVEVDVCPTCAGNLLDPADDIAAEVARFSLEDRVA